MKMRAQQNAQLIRTLVALGIRVRHTTVSSPIRSVATASGVTLLMLAFISLAICGVSYDSRVQHDAARSPHMSAALEDRLNTELQRDLPEGEFDIRMARVVAAAPLAVGQRGDFLRDGLQHSVLIVIPHQPLPPPPGLPRWPSPGEVFLSPQLAADGKAEGIGTRYGKFAGLIGHEGLSAPDERFAYVNPYPGTFPEDQLSPYDEMGAPSGPWWSPGLHAFSGETQAIYPAPYPIALIVILALLPGLVLLLVARSVAADQRAKREAIMDALGARRSQAWLVRVGEAAVPSVVGALLAAGITALLIAVPVRLPLVNWLVPTDELRARWPLMATVLVGASVIALATITVGSAKRSRDSTRPLAKSWQPPRWTGVVFLAAVVAATRLPTLVDPDRRQWWQLTFSVCSIVAICTLPFALTWLVTAVGGPVSTLAHRTRRPSALIAARFAQANPRALLVVFAALGIGIGTLFQAQFVNNTLQERARIAIHVARTLDNRVFVSHYSSGVPSIAEVQRALPPSGQLAVVTYDPSTRRSRLTATCETMARLEIACPPSSNTQPVTAPLTGPMRLVSLAIPQLQPGTSDLKIEDPAHDPQTKSPQWVILTAGAPLDEPTVKSALMPASWPNSGPESPIYSYVGSSFETAQQGQWVALFGLFGLVCALLTIVTTSLRHFLLTSSRLAPIGALAGPATPYRTIAAYLVAMPLFLAGCTGAGLGLVLAQVPVTAQIAPPYGAALAGWIVLATTVITALGWFIAARLATQAGRNWLPGDT
jgi:hypothetical protein